MNDTSNAIVGFLLILVVLPLFILWMRDHIRRARAMHCSIADTVGRAIAYILGVLFVLVGVASFRPDLQPGEILVNPITHYLFSVILIIIGILTWAATRFRYGGGFWFISGIFLAGGALTGIVSMIETHVPELPYESNAYYGRIAAFWVVGFILLFIGHWRHCRKKPGTTQAGPGCMGHERL
jgi:hypothetical protein